ncbi:MAG: amidohydrolase family protein [Pirellulales bacterium]|nr:amidohydrolase family protein [Pirellulales bacterium]
MIEIIDGYCTLGTERETQIAPAELLRRMDRAGIGRAVVAPDDREIAVNNVRGNDRILEECRRAGGRFIPACTVNPWYGPAGCEELRRAAAAGARMLVLAPALQGYCLGDELMDDLLLLAGDLRMPVYVHTGPHSASSPAQLALVAARHPRTSFILGHCGSTDYAYDMPPVIKAGMQNLYFEASLARPWAVGAYGKLAPKQALIFGSSAPRNDAGFELEFLRRYLPPAEYPDVYGGNLARLLKEPHS